MEPRVYEGGGVRDDWKGRGDFFMPGLDVGLHLSGCESPLRTLSDSLRRSVWPAMSKSILGPKVWGLIITQVKNGESLEWVLEWDRKEKSVKFQR